MPPAAIIVPTGLFIHNEFVPSATGQTLAVENPTTGESLGTISAAGPEEAPACGEKTLPVSEEEDARSGWNPGKLTIASPAYVARAAVTVNTRPPRVCSGP